MKKIILAVSLLMALAACQKKTTEYATLSGKITHAKSKTIELRGLNDFKKVITLAEDGTFSDTMKVAAGKYALKNGMEYTTVYLENGFDLTIDLDAEKFDESLSYKGEGAEINNYLAKRQLLAEKHMGANPQALYAADENAFIRKINDYIQALEKEVKTVTGDLAEAEKAEIDLEKRAILSQYEGYHAYIIKDPEFKVSENFPNIYEGLNMWDEEKFEKSGNYKQLVIRKIQDEVGEKMQNDSTLQEIAAIVQVLETKKEGKIRNFVLKDLSRMLSGDAEKDQLIVDAINKLSTDEEIKKAVNEQLAAIKSTAVGEPSPTFSFENYEGKTISLDELKGKLVYIDVWATWCGPCKGEIPHLIKLEKEYHNKDITFVSISVDEEKDKWKEMVKEKQLKGVQLFADKGWKSDFVKAYNINGIPRFILLDKEGKIISPDAPRPSDPKLIDLFKANGLK